MNHQGVELRSTVYEADVLAATPPKLIAETYPNVQLLINHSIFLEKFFKRKLILLLLLFECLFDTHWLTYSCIGFTAVVSSNWLHCRILKTYLPSVKYQASV